MPEDNSFGRQHRLLTARDYQHVFARNRKRGNAHLLVLARANDLGYPRLGLAIAKKHLKRAIDRNRIKRLIREYFRQKKTELGGNDIVVLSRAGCRSASRHEMLTTLDELWFNVIR